MADDSELIKLRDELKQIQEGTRRSRKRATFGFMILVLALVLCAVYGFTQQVAATRNAEEALRQKNLADNARVDAERNAEEALRQQSIANAQRAAAELAMEDARVALAKCKGKK